MKSWTLKVDEDPNTGDLLLPLPQDLLDCQGWKEGDTLTWIDNNDGSWTLKKENNMNSEKIQEILDILQEECGELVVSASKVRRFGLDNSYKDGGTQREHLTQEAGDVMLMIELLIAHEVFTESELQDAKLRKAEKLKVWSKIYE